MQTFIRRRNIDFSAWKLWVKPRQQQQKILSSSALNKKWTDIPKRWLEQVMWPASDLKTSLVRENNAISEICAIKVSPPLCKQWNSARFIKHDYLEYKEKGIWVFCEEQSQHEYQFHSVQKLRKKLSCEVGTLQWLFCIAEGKPSQDGTAAIGSTLLFQTITLKLQRSPFTTLLHSLLPYFRKAASFFSMLSKASIPM